MLNTFNLPDNLLENIVYGMCTEVSEGRVGVFVKALIVSTEPAYGGYKISIAEQIYTTNCIKNRDCKKGIRGINGNGEKYNKKVYTFPFKKKCCSNTVVSIFFLPFPPSTFNPIPLALSMCPLYMFLGDPSPIFPPYPSPPTPVSKI